MCYATITTASRTNHAEQWEKIWKNVALDPIFHFPFENVFVLKSGIDFAMASLTFLLKRRIPIWPTVSWRITRELERCARVAKTWKSHTHW